MIRKTLAILVLSAILLTGPGCSNKASVHGTVRFEDGTPLTTGQVLMEGKTILASGGIDKNGRFQIGTDKIGDGTIPNHYRAWLVGTEEAPFDDDTNRYKITRHVHAKYTSPDTSGLEFEVKPGRNQFEIIVERP